jgi:hypothetical protein
MSNAASAFEEILNAAPDDFVIAVHDLTHAILADRGSGGVKPGQRKMKDAVRIVRAEMEKRGQQVMWNRIRDAFLLKD